MSSVTAHEIRLNTQYRTEGNAELFNNLHRWDINAIQILLWIDFHWVNCFWLRFVISRLRRFILFILFKTRRDNFDVCWKEDKDYMRQESPPAWTQEAYRPPRSKYTLCCSCWGGGVPWAGTPPSGGVPRAGAPCWGVTLGRCPLLGGYPRQAPLLLGGTPGRHPLPGGTPGGCPLPGPWMGYPPPGPGIQTWKSRYPPVQTWKSRYPPPIWTWDGVPPHQLDGVPPPPPRCELTDKLKI